jgi:predicted AAA+ superfamily ATPase
VITFPPFDQQLYLEAVAHLLGRALDPETRAAALKFALEGRGFSGRTARY